MKASFHGWIFALLLVLSGCERSIVKRYLDAKVRGRDAREYLGFYAKDIIVGELARYEIVHQDINVYTVRLTYKPAKGRDTARQQNVQFTVLHGVVWAMAPIAGVTTNSMRLPDRAAKK